MAQCSLPGSKTLGPQEGRPRCHRGEPGVFEKKVAPGKEGTMMSLTLGLWVAEVLQAEKQLDQRP